jgi:heme/copper-type cytochrome/quinol oxidase subunit 2
MKGKKMEKYETEQVTSIGNWIGTFFLLSIPVVNVILSIIWAVSAKSKSKRNYFRAYLVMFAIFAVISIIVLIALGSAAAGLFEKLGNLFNQ